MTQVILLDPGLPQQEAIDVAASIIRNGGLVAFPTETVYGLGADAMNERAIQKLFQAKGRPADNPLIVHISNRGMLDIVATGVNPQGERLIERFWPGPLTLVLKRQPEVATSVSAGLPSVAVRMPANRIALELIGSARTPIAAPSANASSRPSPTTAPHVLEDLGGRIDLILDGGATSIGIESTVLDLTTEQPMILRLGAITREMLIEIIGRVDQPTSGEELRRSPGTRHRHYSPRARVLLIEHGSAESIELICRERLKQGAVGFIGHTGVAIDDERLFVIELGSSADDYARAIYGALRELDQKGARAIVVEGITEDGKGAAVMDRLRRAASEVIE